MRAYTYLIGWSKFNWWYYGVRFSSKRKVENDLWKGYFTSSQIVKNKRDEFGEPDVIEVRRYFENKEDALDWEEKVLRRLKVRDDPKWLNSNIRGHKFANIHGYKRSKSCRAKISERRRQYLESLTPNEREEMIKRSREAGIKGADKISLKAKERFNDPEFVKKHREAHNKPEYKEASSKRTKEWFDNDENRKQFIERLNTKEYKDGQSRDSKQRWADPEFVKKQKEGMGKCKARWSTLEEKLARSERAKASTAKRLEKRRLNKLKNKLQSDKDEQ